MTVNGHTYPRAAECGKQTAERVQKVRIGHFKRASGRRLNSGKHGLPRGWPELTTTPLLCSNCVIHPGHIIPGSVTNGCLHLTRPEFDMVRRCQGRGTVTLIPLRRVPVRVRRTYPREEYLPFPSDGQY